MAALEWALRHGPQDGTIHAVQAVAAGQAELAAADENIEAMRELRNLVDRTRNNLADGTSAATVVPIVESGEPAEVLRSHAERAELLVVGARGRGALAHVLVGSVTTSLADHPATVTVVVPAADRGASRRR